MNKLLELIKANREDIIKPVIVLLAICIVIPLALSVTNSVTESRIVRLQEKNEKDTMSKLIKAENFVSESYGQDDISFDYYKAKTNGEVLGYVFLTSAKGYGGEVSVMTAVDTKGVIIDVAITDASGETPGLGQNVTKENFYSQYKEKTEGVKVIKGGKAAGANTIDAVTGATISSNAVNNAVNKALACYSDIAENSGSEVALNEK